MTYLAPFINFIAALLNLYSIFLIVWIVISLLHHFDIINRRHSIVLKAMQFLDALYRAPLSILRKFIPIIGGVDITPVILYFLILLVRELLFRVY